LPAGVRPAAVRQCGRIAAGRLRFPSPTPKEVPPMAATAAVPFPLAAGTRLLGEVISWTCSGVAVTHAALVAALKDAGLDESVARELAPRHAFTRACKKLSDARIIRRVAEDEAAGKFQFTAEHRSADRSEYEWGTMRTLDEKSGTGCCDLPSLATLAQEHL